MSRNLPTLSCGGQTTRAAGTERPTGHCVANVSEWQDDDYSQLEFTICIVTLKLRKRQKPKSERFTAHGCRVKLFQVSVGRSSQTVFFSLLPMIAKKETANLRVSNGSPKTAQLCDQPASPPAVRRPQFAGSGWIP